MAENEVMTTQDPGGTAVADKETQAETVNTGWLADVAEGFKAFREGAADQARAAELIRDAQKSRHERNSILDRGSGDKAWSPREIRLASRSYEKAMELEVDPRSPHGAWIHEAQQLNDELMDLNTAFAAERMEAMQRGRTYDRDIRKTRRYAELQDLATKADADWWGTGSTDRGIEWQPTVYSTQVVPFERLPLNLAGAFPASRIPRGERTRRIPVISARSSVTAAAEYDQTSGTSAPSFPLDSEVSTPTPSYIELTATYKFAGATAASREADEDSVVDVMSTHRMELTKSMLEAYESCIINGSSDAFGTTGVDLDGANRSGVGAGLSNQVFYGLRHYLFYSNQNDPGSARSSAYTTSLGGADITHDDVIDARKNMGKFATVAPTRLRLIVSPSGFLGMLKDPLVKTIDVYGTQATVVTGELARIGGIPIIVSEWMPENLAITGRNNGGAGTTTAAILVRPDRWMLGIKRDLEVIAIPGLSADVLYLRSFLRATMDSAPPDTDKHSWGLHNVATT